MSGIPAISFAASALVSGTATLVTAKQQDSSAFAWTAGGIGAVGAVLASGHAYDGGVLGSAVAGAGVGAVLGAMLGASLRD